MIVIICERSTRAWVVKRRVSLAHYDYDHPTSKRTSNSESRVGMSKQCVYMYVAIKNKYQCSNDYFCGV